MNDNKPLYFWLFLIIIDMYMVNIFKLNLIISNSFKIISGIFLLYYYFKNNELKKQELFLTCIYMGTIVISFNQVKMNVLYIFLFIKNIKLLKQLEKKIVIFVTILFCLNLLMLKFGIIKNKVFYGIERIRNGLGFTNPNIFAIFYFYLAIYLWNKKMKFYMNRYLSVFFILYIYIKTDSRTQLLGFVLYIFFNFYFQRKKGKKKNIYRLRFLKAILFFNYLYLILGIFPEKYLFLDKLLSYRLTIINDVLRNLTLKEYILGSSQISKYSIDNTFLVLNYNLGFLFGNIFILIIFYKIKDKIKKFSDTEYSFIIICLIMGIFESFLIRIQIITTMIFYYLIFKKMNKKCKNSNKILRRE